MTERTDTTNPWVALRPGQDVDQYISAMRRAHGRFADHSVADHSGTRLADVRPVVRESWLRSLERGIDLDVVAQSRLLSGPDLEQYRSGHPMAVIRPVVRRLLVEDAADEGLLVAVSDERGRLLWVDGDHRERDRASAMSFLEGADWSESVVGTNAPGTALALDHAVQIVAAEHYNRIAHDWSCSAAPVHDPISGRVLGTIDITGGSRIATPEVLRLVRATAHAAEAELRLHLLSAPRPEIPTTRVQVCGTGRPTLIRDGHRTPISRRHAEILLILTDRPAGLGAEHLAVLLDDTDLDPVTVRAEMSRLRKVLGADLLASRPYRLTAELATDVADVRAALDRGDVASALEAYAGPVLPGSDAPAVREIREEMHVRLQAALLRAGDARLLARWTASDHGRDDHAAWTAFRSSLDPASSLVAQVDAQIALLDRRLAT